METDHFCLFEKATDHPRKMFISLTVATLFRQKFKEKPQHQKMKFSMKGFFSKYDQIHSFRWI